MATLLFVIAGIVFLVGRYFNKKIDISEDKKFSESIKHLPDQKRAELWLAKLRHDAERE